MNKELKMPLSFFTKPMNVLGLVFGLVIASSTITLPGGLITVLVARYNAFILFPHIALIFLSLQLSYHFVILHY